MSEDGGAMAEEEVSVENLAGDGDAEARVEPTDERLGRAATRLQEKAEKALEANLFEVVNCIVTNARQHHLPSAKMLFELCRRVTAREHVPEGMYQSLAELLWDAKQREMQENKLDTAPTA